MAELDKGSKDGGVAVGMVLHSLSDNVGHLGVAAVVHIAHSVQNPPLDGFKTVHDVWHGPLQDHIRGIVQEPVFEHPGQLIFLAVRAEQPVILARGWGRGLF